LATASEADSECEWSLAGDVSLAGSVDRGGVIGLCWSTFDLVSSSLSAPQYSKL